MHSGILLGRVLMGATYTSSIAINQKIGLESSVYYCYMEDASTSGKCLPVTFSYIYVHVYQGIWG